MKFDPSKISEETFKRVLEEMKEIQRQKLEYSTGIGFQRDLEKIKKHLELHDVAVNCPYTDAEVCKAVDRVMESVIKYKKFSGYRQLESDFPTEEFDFEDLVITVMYGQGCDVVIKKDIFKT